MLFGERFKCTHAHSIRYRRVNVWYCLKNSTTTKTRISSLFWIKIKQMWRLRMHWLNWNESGVRADESVLLLQPPLSPLLATRRGCTVHTMNLNRHWKSHIHTRAHAYMYTIYIYACIVIVTSKWSIWNGYFFHFFPFVAIHIDPLKSNDKSNLLNIYWIAVFRRFQLVYWLYRNTFEC